MKHTETGRSMVEMLGVLAIIGVISVSGLMGYTYAMKRLRANELLNEANKQAVLVASALMTNPNPENIPTIDAPTTPYGNFGNSIELVDDKFKMAVSGLDEGTCEMMQSLATGPIRRLECDPEENTDTFTATMYFNKDLSTEERASDYTSADTCKSPYKWCAEASTPSCAEDCCAGVSLNDCQTACNSATGAITPKEDGKICDYTAEGAADGTCQSGSCVETPTINCDDYPGSGLEGGQVYVGGIAGFASDNETICRCPAGKGYNGTNCDLTCSSSGTCLNNEGLCPGYYCKASVATDGSTCSTAQGDITALPMIIPTLEVNGYTYYTSGGYTYLGTNNNGNVYYSTNGTTMSWDGAYYYCKAVGTKLGKNVGLAWPKKSDGTDCPALQTCPNWPVAAYWLNKAEKVTTVMNFNGRQITKTSVGNTLANPNDDFCYTWVLSSGSVSYNGLRRNDGYDYALCE